jgi:hypothetical protein
MSGLLGFDRCLTYLNCQLQPAGKLPEPQREGGWRAVTISRQTGAGGHAVAEALRDYLQAAADGDSRPWTVFDRNLVERVLEDHHLPKQLAQFMVEDRISEISDTMDELFGLHPPLWTIVHKTAETILHLVELGNVILVGRGSHIVTRKLDYVFHVRLVGSLGNRVEHIQRAEKLSAKAARKLVDREDRGRRRFVRKYFGEDIDNPLLYHVVINTDLVPHERTARMIGDAMLGRVGGAEA